MTTRSAESIAALGKEPEGFWLARADKPTFPATPAGPIFSRRNISQPFYLRDRVTDRKARLFAVDCGRRAWDRIDGPTCQAIERFAEGHAPLRPDRFREDFAVLGERAVCQVLRHHFNPFVSQPDQPFPSSAVQLAEVLDAGEPVAGPLADALEEARLPQLAAHFRDEPDYPQGCWALDAILGKS